MKLNFQPYEVERARAIGEDIISVMNNGSFGFSTSFVSKNIPDKPKYVSLNYAQDMDNIYVGFGFSNEKKKNYLTVNYPKKYGIVSTIGFFKKYGVNPAKFKGGHKAEEYTDDLLGKIFIIKLKK